MAQDLRASPTTNHHSTSGSLPPAPKRSQERSDPRSRGWWRSRWWRDLLRACLHGRGGQLDLYIEDEQTLFGDGTLRVVFFRRLRPRVWEERRAIADADFCGLYFDGSIWDWFAEGFDERLLGPSYQEGGVCGPPCRREEWLIDLDGCDGYIFFLFVK